MRLGFAVLTLVVLPSVGSAQTQLPTDAAGLRMAYFSPERAFAQSVAGKTAQAKLASLQAEKEKEITARNLRLKALQDALQQGASVLGDAARRQRELEVERFSIDVQRFVEDAKASSWVFSESWKMPSCSRSGPRSEERRVGKESRSGWWTGQEKKRRV